MSVLKNLEPNKVFYFFEEITKIPRESGNERAISNYLVKFAKERGLEVDQDESLNVLIRKPATRGYENAKGVILQGHMDMVCVKEADSNHDFLKDPLKIYIDGDKIRARGTSLGADNGIAIAYSLAILDSDDIAHPDLEVLVTTDEEVGLLGAMSFDSSKLKGQYFINLDSETEGEIIIACAGGLKSVINLSCDRIDLDLTKYLSKEIVIEGLKGGHSGAEIHTARANANKLMGRLLMEYLENESLYLLDIMGGTRDNVIPSRALARVFIPKDQLATFNKYIEDFSLKLKSELEESEAGLIIRLEDFKASPNERPLSQESLEKLVFLITASPNGVMHMEQKMPEYVETSLSLGVVEMDKDHCKLSFSIRSSRESRKKELESIIRAFAKTIGAEYYSRADYPGWQAKPKNPLRDIAVAVYKDMVGHEAKVLSIHAGLESGVILAKRPDLDAISFGPNMWEVHSVNEHLSISSSKRVFDYLLKLLENIK